MWGLDIAGWLTAIAPLASVGAAFFAWRQARIAAQAVRRPEPIIEVTLYHDQGVSPESGKPCYSYQLIVRNISRAALVVDWIDGRADFAQGGMTPERFAPKLAVGRAVAPLDQAGEGRATYRQIFIVHAKKRPIRFRVAYRWNDEPQKTRKKVITA